MRGTPWMNEGLLTRGISHDFHYTTWWIGRTYGPVIMSQDIPIR